MIFDADHVARLVKKYQYSKHQDVLASILESSRSLVEAVVSSYDPEDREDMIQEVMLKLTAACMYYNPSVGTLHNYFTTVAHNTCITYSQKATKEYLLDDNNTDAENDDEYSPMDIPDVNVIEDCLDSLLDESLQDLILHNRKRFPSLPASVLDEASEIVYSMLRQESNYKAIVNTLCTLTSIPRSIATIVFQSSIVYLRLRHMTNACNHQYKNEFTLINDLKVVLGEEGYNKLMICFSGLYVKFPQ